MAPDPEVPPWWRPGMDTPSQAKRRIVRWAVGFTAIPAVGLVVALVIGHGPLALLSAAFVILMIAGSVVNGRRSWRAYLDGPPGDHRLAD